MEQPERKPFTPEQERAMERIREIAATHNLAGMAVWGNDTGDVRGHYCFEAKWAHVKSETPQIYFDGEKEPKFDLRMQGLLHEFEVFINGAVFSVVAVVAGKMAENLRLLMEKLRRIAIEADVIEGTYEKGVDSDSSLN